MLPKGFPKICEVFGRLQILRELQRFFGDPELRWNIQNGTMSGIIVPLIFLRGMICLVGTHIQKLQPLELISKLLILLYEQYRVRINYYISE